MYDAVRQFADRIRPPAAGSDADLLGRFVAARDETAFTEMVRRHGPMVFGVCRRLTRSHHDAEDAFQAAFLVLASRADTIRPPERLGAWLHGVATNTSRKAGRRRLTHPLTDVPAPEPSDPATAEALDLALSSLPPKYRLPLVLCHLEGRSRKDAALALGWPEGTVSGRLARGLKLLGDRLQRQGVELPVVAGLSVAVPAGLSAATIERAVLVAAGLSAVPAHLLPLTNGAVPVLPLRRVVLLLAGLLVVGATGLYALPTTEPPAAKQTNGWMEFAGLTLPERVSRVAYGPPGVVAADAAGTVRVWKPDSRDEPRTQVVGVGRDGRGASNLHTVERLRFSTDGKWLYQIGDGQRSITRSPTTNLDFVMGAGSFGGRHDISPDGLIVLHTFDPADKCVTLQPTGHDKLPPEWAIRVSFPFDSAVTRAAMSPDRSYLAVGLANGTVQMVTMDDQVNRRVLPVAGGAAVELQFSPDSGRLAVVEPGGAVVVFAHRSGAKRATFSGHTGGTAAVTWHPKGHVLATAGADKAVRLWDVTTGKPGQVLTGHTEAMTDVAFSPDGNRLVSGSADKSVRVWEFRQ